MRAARYRSRILAVLSCLVSLAALAPAARSQSANVCDQPGESPDLIVGDIWQSRYWATIGGISAYSFGTDACNVGTCWVNWFDDNANHPVIAQNMFRLKDGRFEQIGQSWLKHGFGAANDTLCSPLCIHTNGDHLGVNCSDAYGASLNGSQGILGPKFEVNPHNGSFPFPPTGWGQTGSAIYRRLQVSESDLLSASNPGALYFVESQYVAADDAVAGNQDNNVSWRRILLQGVATVQFSGPTKRVAGIRAWKFFDPFVVETNVGVPSDGLYILAAKATTLGGGWWRYEYALQNLNASRPAIRFTAPIPVGSQSVNVGFHDVDYHSGEIQEGTDWTASLAPGEVSWLAEAVPADDRRTNALRWGTLYNFRFDSDAPPGTHEVTIGLSGPAGQVTASTLAPNRCDDDGICDPGESCATCAPDCAGQGGGAGCCGNGSCEGGEDGAACFADCGVASSSEALCGDNRDEDRDGLTDCTDPDCCVSPACDGFDIDGDQKGICDCNDANSQVWSVPGESQHLLIFPSGGSHAIIWNQDSGSTFGPWTVYEAVRSPDAADFVTEAVCLPMALPDPTFPQTRDSDSPATGAAFYYLAHAKNSCGDGSWGASSSSVPRTVRTCP